MGKLAQQLAQVNKQLGGALEDTPTWLNEKAKTTPGAGIRPWFTRLLAHVKGLRFVRALMRYGVARGALLAGGIAYSAMFAIAGALAIGFTIFSYTLGGNPRLFAAVVERVNRALPGVVKTPDMPDGLLDPNTLILDNPINVVSIISMLVLLWSALSLMGSLRTSIQAMFGIVRLPIHPAIAKLLELSGFLVLGLGVVVSTVLSAGAQFFAEPIFQFLHLPEAWGFIMLRVISVALSMAVDIGIFIFLFRVMSAVRALKRDLFYGALLGAVASALVRYLGTSAVGSVANNALLAPFAAIATLLLWVNLVARITLISAAFAANPPEQAQLLPENFEHARETPNFVTISRLETLAWDFDPMSGVVIAQPEKPAQVDIPSWRGLRAWVMRTKVNRAQSKMRKAQADYERVKADYDRAALSAHGYSFDVDTRIR
ncbi:MAG: YihY/virulence factor BrkB family protein [Actinomycetaceae bacterium]|nr:YihY/virulence factor BrkB family protein [Arcanobacterium sp.]MDD7686886.1 YihY/virulence factor BrkB family protein [Actinomycetaceae bacterium]MDY5274023.1 YihY/virulence factor BrkB family protein [Arcanobacterium sp.]